MLVLLVLTGNLRAAHQRRLCRASAAPADITQRLSMPQDILAMCFELCAERIAA